MFVDHSVRLLLTGLCLGGTSALAARDEGFYHGKQIRLIVGTDAGGSYDFSARLVARYLSAHIPGNPQVIVENMPGASSINAANYIYNSAPQDGAVIGAFIQTLPYDQIFGNESVKFDVSKFNWLGNPASSVNVIVTTDASPVKSFEQALENVALIGVTSRASSGSIEISLADNVLGAKFRAVTGYKGGNEIDLAMERREVFGRAGQSWDGWKRTRPDWVANGKLNILVQIGHARAKDLPNTPLMTELAHDDESRQILALYSDTVALGRPLAVGPGVPKERVELLRNAFQSVMSDPMFIAEAARLSYDVEPLSGGEVQTMIGQMAATPPAIIVKAKEAFQYKGP